MFSDKHLMLNVVVRVQESFGSDDPSMEVI